jgi:hypothetical protein
VREFEVPASGDTVVFFPTAGRGARGLTAKPIGRNMSADAYKIEADRIPIRLERGRHQFL